MHDFLVSVAAFIVLVGLMVVVHELGHFCVAKYFGVRVESFSVGFGPRLFGIKYGDTDYKVCLLPLGGFVKMTGELPTETGAEGQHIEDPGSFNAHPRWQRMLIGLAGPVANFILAFVLMLMYFNWINEVPRYDVKTTTIEWVVPGTPAAQAGLQPGDVIRRFDNVNNPNWDRVNQQAAISMNQTVPLTVDRDGKMLPLSLFVPSVAKGQEFNITVVGMIPQITPGPIGVQQVMPDSPASRAGLLAGDQIQSVDGHRFHSVPALLAYMQEGKGKPLSLSVVRHGVTLPPIVATPAKLEGSQWILGFAPVPIPFHHKPLPLNQAIVKSTGFCADNSLLIVEVLERIFAHQVSISQLSGPVGIAQWAGEAAEAQGWLPKFTLASAISLNLGILNLLPFPILDGGLIALLLIESVLRRDISRMVKERLFQTAFVVLMVFTVFLIFNDVTKLPIFTHVKP
jgi:regulator of sigma E protease